MRPLVQLIQRTDQTASPQFIYGAKRMSVRGRRGHEKNQSVAKARIVLLVFVFLFCAALGFLAASELGLLVPERTTSQKDPLPAAFPKQQNFLLIHTRELGVSRPTLVSIWLVLFANYDSPYLAFKTLYPSITPSEHSLRLEKRFSLSADGSPSQDFFETLRAANVHWDGHILVDDYGLQAILRTEGEELPALSAAPSGAAAPETLLQQQTAILNDFCARLQSDREKALNFQRWGTLIPAHLRTNLNFETIMVNWYLLTSSEMLPQCKVFGAQ